MQIQSDQVNAVLKALRDNCTTTHEAASVLVAVYIALCEVRPDQPDRDRMADEFASAVRSAVITWTKEPQQ